MTAAIASAAEPRAPAPQDHAQLRKSFAYADIVRGKKGWGAQRREAFAAAGDTPAAKPPA